MNKLALVWQELEGLLSDLVFGYKFDGETITVDGKTFSLEEADLNMILYALELYNGTKTLEDIYQLKQYLKFEIYTRNPALLVKGEEPEIEYLNLLVDILQDIKARIEKKGKK